MYSLCPRGENYKLRIIMKIRKGKGCGWNKRRSASNNFVAAIEHGDLPGSYLANILGVNESVVWRMLPSKTHHVKRGKKIKAVKTFSLNNITIETYIAIQAKSVEMAILARGVKNYLAKIAKKECIVKLRSDIKHCTDKVTEIKREWTKASLKLIKKYTPTII